MQSEVSIIKDIYNVIDSVDPDTVTMSGEDGNPTSDREQAKVLSFPYYNYGKIAISILNPSNLLVLVSPEIGRAHV